MTSLEFILGFTQITFPLFIAIGTAIPFVTPTATHRLAPVVGMLFFVALVDLWSATIVGVITLMNLGEAIDIIVACAAAGSSILISYVLIVPFVTFLIEVALYRSVITSLPKK